MPLLEATHHEHSSPHSIWEGERCYVAQAMCTSDLLVDAVGGCITLCCCIAVTVCGHYPHGMGMLQGPAGCCTAHAPCSWCPTWDRCLQEQDNKGTCISRCQKLFTLLHEKEVAAVPVCYRQCMPCGTLELVHSLQGQGPSIVSNTQQQLTWLLDIPDHAAWQARV